MVLEDETFAGKFVGTWGLHLVVTGRDGKQAKTEMFLLHS